MGKETLIIVESNGKTKKIEKFTGHQCVASFGHVFALKPTLKWFDPENIDPEYIIHKGKEKIISNLKAKAKAASRIIIASDLDREGEAIAAHLMKLLKLNVNKTERITFNQISESALKEAIENSGKLDKNLYNAQQARAVIDIVFGFKVSPFLSNHLNIRALSAGRCQSPAVRMCMQRQNEQKIGEISIKINANSNELKNIVHIEPIFSYDTCKDEIMVWLKNLENQKFRVTKVKVSKKKETPPPPFITSSLQQMAYNRFSYNPKRTMDIAQKLYEGGYITYMRTDSVILSSQFQDMACKWIKEEYGEEYVNLRQYGKKKSGGVKTQDAHEAIRPININNSPPNNNEQQKLYELIKLRAIASQMAQAIYSESKLSLETLSLGEKKIDIWESITKTLIFPGFTCLKGNIIKDDLQQKIENVTKRKYKVNDELNIVRVNVKEHASLPPPPFNPAGFVKMLEKTGIGRPSTYSSIIERIQEKDYICLGKNKVLDTELNEWTLDNKNDDSEKIVKGEYLQKIGGQSNIFVVTDLGQKACEFMDSSPIEPIVNSAFTSELEDKLDQIAKGNLDWKIVVKEFYSELVAKLSLQPPPKRYKNSEKEINWIRILEKSSEHTIGIIRTQYGLCIAKESENNEISYSKMPPNTSPEELEIKEALNMFNYPLNIKDNIEIRIGPYGWYVTNGMKNISLGQNRNPPSKEDGLKAIEQKPTSEIIKKINKYWTLRRKKDSYFLMYSKGKKPIFYPVHEHDGEWSVLRCEEIQKKNKRRK
tara:strand:- start:7726 stop:10023 length:2298 start_codon:yes stop_codon:yes gene_type:complete